MMPARLQILAIVVLFVMTLGTLGAGSPSATEAESQEPPRHPDWLYAQDIKLLLSGNTLTSLNAGGSYRWWTLYLHDGVLSSVNDRGKRAYGIWYIAQDRLCHVWLSGRENCWGVRVSGKAVRFDDIFTGKPRFAAVLQSGDTKNLRANVTSEIYERLQDLRGSQSELATVEDGEDQLGGSETVANNRPAGEPDARPIKIRIVHPDPEASNDLIGALSGVQLAATNEIADLVWNVYRGEIVEDNEIVAYPRTREPSEVQLVIDVLRLIDEIESVGSQRSGGLSLQMAPRQSSYRAGESIELTLLGHEFQHALLFNIGPYGEIDIVYPADSDFAGDGTVWPRLAPAKPLSISVVAGPPFGANLVVGLVSSSEPKRLLKILKSGGGPAGFDAYLKALRETEGQLAVSDFRIQR